MKNLNLRKVLFYLSTGLLTLLLLASFYNYLFNQEAVAVEFTKLKFPTWIILPLGIAKFCAAIMLWVRKPNWLLSLAYAGLFYNFIMALGAHLAAQDNEWLGAIVALTLLLTSYITSKKAQSEHVKID